MRTLTAIGGELAVLVLALTLTGVVLRTRRLVPWALVLALAAAAFLAASTLSQGRWPLGAICIGLFMVAAYQSYRWHRQRPRETAQPDQ